MKKSVKIKIWNMIVMLAFCTIIISKMYAMGSMGSGFNSGFVSGGTVHLQAQADNIKNIIIKVLQIAAIAGVVFAGVSYMFASSNQRADIKKKLIPLCFGIVLVFAGATFVDFITTAFNDATSSGSAGADVAISRLWGVILTALQVASISAVIFAGVRYMISSSDQRADIKNSFVYLMIGAIIVFASSTFVQFITNTWGQLAA